MVTSTQDADRFESERPATAGPARVSVSVSDWNPSQYLRFADERTRPFRDLLAQVHLSSASRIVEISGAARATGRLCCASGGRKRGSRASIPVRR